MSETLVIDNDEHIEHLSKNSQSILETEIQKRELDTCTAILDGKSGRAC